MQRVLFVDDDAALTRTFQRMFSSAECSVDVANDGMTALPLLEETDYDLVVSDYEMPLMDGAELLARVCDRRPDTVRVLVTGSNDFDAAMAAVNRGEVFRLLKKPWIAEDVRFVVRLALETRQLQQQTLTLRDQLAASNDSLRRLNEQLERTVEERTTNLLDALITALDVRDADAGHPSSRRVARYAQRLAQELALSDEEVRVVEQGALLHDIGKIGVPDAVLQKPGKLTEAEWATMKRHPRLGWEMLRKIDFLAGAREVVLQHRERWDGTGYGSGLAGNEICIGARVFAVVDTFDAITTDRPYRRAASYAVARAELERVAGTQLDPRVVEAFCRVEETEWASLRRDSDHAS
jgi:putative nucleotidyltransferase with HDIG domain